MPLCSYSCFLRPSMPPSADPRILHSPEENAVQEQSGGPFPERTEIGIIGIEDNMSASEVFPEEVCRIGKLLEVFIRNESADAKVLFRVVAHIVTFGGERQDGTC